MSTYSSSSFLLDGVHRGCYYGQQDRVDELNTRIQDRQIPDRPLAPNYDPRPVPTKYSLFPVVDRRVIPKEPLDNKLYLDNNDSNFYVSSKFGPPTNFLKNVNVETALRNQGVALQHGAEQGVYVPSSDSDLYKLRNPSSRPGAAQPFPGLFNRYVPEQNSVKPIVHTSIGKDLFANHTRTQLRTIPH
jgi:hypothetical protein